MIRKKYGIYVIEKQTSKNIYHYYKGCNNYITVITTITKLKIAINTLHSLDINIQ